SVVEMRGDLDEVELWHRLVTVDVRGDPIKVIPPLSHLEGSATGLTLNLDQHRPLVVDAEHIRLEGVVARHGILVVPQRVLVDPVQYVKVAPMHQPSPPT